MSLIPRVAELGRQRPAFRDYLRQSPLCDGKGLTACLEETFTGMFDRWQKEKSGRAKT